mmetsp:Transcript_118570/g.382803  ORF Transcript_118570/g.382803 Transcript_118570/m.382803 type:complete len:307 (-) Transcript_118570:524-1444(-)
MCVPRPKGRKARRAASEAASSGAAPGSQRSGRKSRGLGKTPGSSRAWPKLRKTSRGPCTTLPPTSRVCPSGRNLGMDPAKGYRRRTSLMHALQYSSFSSACTVSSPAPSSPRANASTSARALASTPSWPSRCSSAIRDVVASIVVPWEASRSSSRLFTTSSSFAMVSRMRSSGLVYSSTMASMALRRGFWQPAPSPAAPPPAAARRCTSFCNRSVRYVRMRPAACRALRNVVPGRLIGGAKRPAHSVSKSSSRRSKALSSSKTAPNKMSAIALSCVRRTASRITHSPPRSASPRHISWKAAKSLGA